MAGEAVSLQSATIGADGLSVSLAWSNPAIVDGIGSLSGTAGTAAVIVAARGAVIALASVDSLTANGGDTGWLETATLSVPVYAGETAIWSSSLGHITDDTEPPHRSAATTDGTMTNNSEQVEPSEPPPFRRGRGRQRLRWR